MQVYVVRAYEQARFVFSERQKAARALRAANGEEDLSSEAKSTSSDDESSSGSLSLSLRVHTLHER